MIIYMMMEHGQLVFAGKVDEFDNYIVPNSILLHLANAPATEVLDENRVFVELKSWVDNSSVYVSRKQKV